MSKLPKSFFLNENVLEVSEQLLGKVLCTKIDGILTSGMIVETEAYNGISDKASHAFGNRRTKRTEIMFGEGGFSYVYLCYGIYSLFNVVTNLKEIPHAVLIRAIEPIDGIEKMLERRGKSKLETNLTSGPGILSQALGINFREHNGLDLQKDEIWIESRGVEISKNEILRSSRVGVDYAEEDAKLPWRFRIQNNKWTSKAK
ncbi:MAG: DNA-3-methyladenine glycosylase [Calditrichaeota bacterium]|nr:MAG: DNA-3-methyladenine glycosylase [Calditrichota bacterium]